MKNRDDLNRRRILQTAAIAASVLSLTAKAVKKIPSLRPEQANQTRAGTFDAPEKFNREFN